MAAPQYPARNRGVEPDFPFPGVEPVFAFFETDGENFSIFDEATGAVRAAATRARLRNIHAAGLSRQ